MGEEEAATASLNVGGLEACTIPFDGGIVVVEIECVGAPIDLRVGLGEPGLTKDQVVIFERVEDGVESVGVIVAFQGDGNSVAGERGRPVGKEDRDRVDGGTR